MVAMEHGETAAAAAAAAEWLWTHHEAQDDEKGEGFVEVDGMSGSGDPKDRQGLVRENSLSLLLPLDD